jgi:2-succinyl-5-enolpyruvyl-6-hydroxy-3-cyclohexene-1-carboxylate synthase
MQTQMQTQIQSSGFLSNELLSILKTWQTCDRGLIIAGVDQPVHAEAYCSAIAQLSKTLGWPVLAEGLSPVRNYHSLNPNLVSTYDLVLRNSERAAQLAPQQVIRIGKMPTSKVLRQWLIQTQPRQWIIGECDRNLDPLHGFTRSLPVTLEDLAGWAQSQSTLRTPSPYLQQWCGLEAKAQQRLDTAFTAVDSLIEAKAVWLLSQQLPPQTPLFIANSMPVRDLEWFWQPGNRQIVPCFNRGANGIDGTLSTALGMAQGQAPSVLLTGDLALLHDTNGFLIRPQFRGHLTVIVINNQGGGIFEMLPIAQFEPPFEQFFATPQAVSWADLSAAYSVEYQQISTWSMLEQSMLEQQVNSMPKTGLRLLELRCDRKADQHWRQALFQAFSQG